MKVNAFDFVWYVILCRYGQTAAELPSIHCGGGAEAGVWPHVQEKVSLSNLYQLARTSVL